MEKVPNIKKYFVRIYFVQKIVERIYSFSKYAELCFIPGGVMYATRWNCIKTNGSWYDKKMRRRGSKGKGRVPRQYFERTSAVRLLIHSLETRCFRRVLQWVIARSSVILNWQVPCNSDAFIVLYSLKKQINLYVIRIYVLIMIH